jgi:hypothetical protein
MERSKFWTKVIATCGSVLIWLPLAAPLVLGLIVTITDGKFIFDYLMPGEMFPVLFVGAGLAIWAALRTKQYVKGISWSVGAAILFLLASQGTAMLTGLANGQVSADGWQWVLTLSIYICFLLASVTLGIFSLLLTIRVFKKKN